MFFVSLHSNDSFIWNEQITNLIGTERKIAAKTALIQIYVYCLFWLMLTTQNDVNFIVIYKYNICVDKIVKTSGQCNEQI